MNKLNRVEIIGELIQDFRLEIYGDGTCYADFKLAVTKPIGNTPQHADYTSHLFHIMVFSQEPHLWPDFLQRGSRILVIGELTNCYQLNGEGQKFVTTAVIASQLICLDWLQLAPQQAGIAG